VIDKGSIELIVPYGLEKGLVTLSRKMANLDTGVITTYALYILVVLMFYVLMLYSYTIDNNIIILTIFALLTIIKNNKLKWAFSNPPKPYASTSFPLQSNIMNLKTTILSKISFEIRIKLFLLSIGGSILMLYAIHIFLMLLGFSFLYPIFTAIHLCIIMVSGLFIQGKDPPSGYFLITTFITTLIFGAAFHYLFISYIAYLLCYLPAGYIVYCIIDNNSFTNQWRLPHHDIQTQPHIFLDRLYDIKVFLGKKMDNII